VEARRRSGVGWYAYDPDLHLVYYGTGNPGFGRRNIGAPSR